MVPIYTTEDAADVDAPVDRAWLVWTDGTHLGETLSRLSAVAASQGAHAVVAVKHSCWHYANEAGFTVHHYLLGTAVLFGTYDDEDEDEVAEAV